MQFEGVLEKIFRIVKILITCDMKPCRWLRGTNVLEELGAPIFVVKTGMLICTVMIALDLAFPFGKRQQFLSEILRSS